MRVAGRFFIVLYSYKKKENEKYNRHYSNDFTI